MSICLLIYYYFRFIKTNVHHVGIILPVSIFTFACHSASACQISSKSDHSRHSCDGISIFSRWRPGYRNSTSGFGFRDFAHLGRSKCICIPNSGEISQSAAEILLVPVSENKRPPCWNFTSRSDFYVCATIGMSFSICLPNSVQIGPCATELRRHIHFSRWRPRYRNSTSAFYFRFQLS